MLKRFEKYIKENDLFTPKDSILAAISGGIDSVVLLDLLSKSGYRFGIAHCNFRLRGEESDADQHLVEKLAGKYNKPLFLTSFNTREYAHEHGLSLEMAARELRYRWFETIRSDNQFDWITVAHHRDDQIETFFLNLARGTGLAGLTGIRPVNDKVIRPLLFASRKDIEKYCMENSLEYREDASNKDTNIQRNMIRHKILPRMEELNPSFREVLIKTMNNLQDSQKIENTEINNAWERVSSRDGEDYLLSIEELKMLNPLSSYLFRFLKPFHFNSDVVKEIVASIEQSPGKRFLSRSHRIVKDREYLILRKLIGEEKKEIHYIDETCSELNHPIRLKVSIIEKKYKFEIPDSPKVGCFDLGKIQFPLIIRQWQKGDNFRPLGMHGQKKLSDFFVDLKLSLPEKENTWILANGKEIMWIIGRRLDERYKITPKTRHILRMELI